MLAIALALSLGCGARCQALCAPVFGSPQFKLALDDSRKFGVTFDFDLHARYLH